MVLKKGNLEEYKENFDMKFLKKAGFLWTILRRVSEMKDRWSDTNHRFIVRKNIPPTERDVQEFSTRKLVELSCNI